MVDVFEEVEDQIRTERYRALGLKLLPWAIGLLAAGILFSLGLWGWDYWTNTKADEAASKYVAAAEAMQANDAAKAFSTLDEVAKMPVKAYPALALMNQGGMRLQEGRTQEAVALFDKAAEKAGDEPVIGDLARLKSALALLDTAPYKDLEARLTPLMENDRPYRAEAREALGFAKLMAGKSKEAREDFVVLSQGLDSTDSIRTRARAAIALIDSGSAGSIPAAVKVAATAGPQAPAPQAPQGPAQ